MPVILTQHFSANDRPYEDAEYSLYHYPRVYFNRVRSYDRFIYYRPLGKSQAREDSKHYFGYGVLGEVADDPFRADHRFVKYYKILAAADMSSEGLSFLPSTESIAALPFPDLSIIAPRDRFRKIEKIPPGAGYVPSGQTILNVYESAALQERARRDHQDVLLTIQQEVLRRGGSTWYNNNVDLFARVGEDRMLIEAKSIGDFRNAVDRMRYGIGQLADYSYRYREELEGARKVLAFGHRPPRELTWLGNILDQERTAFVHASDGTLEPLNESARSLPIF